MRPVKACPCITARLIQITLILVRGLKHTSSTSNKRYSSPIQITLILVRGLKLPRRIRVLDIDFIHSNNADPREGIKTQSVPYSTPQLIVAIQITLILVRGLKLYEYLAHRKSR